MTAQAQTWYLFVASMLALMGLRLACDAQDEAKSMAAWGGDSAEGALTRRWVLAYRAAGATFCVAGAALALATAGWPRGFSQHAGPMGLGTRGRMASGAFLALTGLGMAISKATRSFGPPTLPRSLEADGLLPCSGGSARRVVSAAAGWLMAVDLVFYGWFLYSSR